MRTEGNRLSFAIALTGVSWIGSVAADSGRVRIGFTLLIVFVFVAPSCPVVLDTRRAATPKEA